jgi:hypothetical protein
MDTAPLQSSYDAALEAYEVSLNKISFWRKRNTLILIVGTATIVLTILGKAFFYQPPPPKPHLAGGADTLGFYYTDSFFYSSVEHSHSGWVNLEIATFCALGAIICGWLGRRVRAFDLPAPAEALSEHDYELALKETSEGIGENDELINQQKRMAAFSLCLFLATDLMLIFL